MTDHDFKQARDRDAIDALFGIGESHGSAEPAQLPLGAPPKPPGKPRGITLTASHTKFVTEFLKTPDNQRGAYLRVYPKASLRWASQRAYRLLRRSDVRAEIQRRQKISATKAAISRAAVEQRLYDIFNFDMRRLFHPSTMENGNPHPKAGQPKEPHELDAEAAQIIEAYEKAIGRYGDKVKLRTTPRLGAAELLAKLRGWVKDDGRPPITANFNFNFGPKPGQNADMRSVEAVPPQLYGAMGFRAEGQRADPIPQDVDENGEPVKSTLPPGYEPGRGVRITSRGRELADDLATSSGRKT